RRKKLKDPHTISPNSYENTIDKVDTELSTTDIKIYRLNYANEEVSLPFNNESLGTKKLAPLLALILYVLDNGLVLVIDEIGNSIHSLLLAEMIRLFKDKRYNKSNAQLIFTTHNTDVMDHELMRISEIGIINKTLKKGTTIVRVSDFDGIRNVTRFRKQYLDGRFSGIPFPYI
ncbi:MAG: AAA family ATPase, partial [Sphaerochaetaceae bacterium]